MWVYLVAAFGSGASMMLWLVHALVLRGIQGATVLNAVVTVAKVVPLLLFVALVATAFQMDTFRLDFWGTVKLGSVLDQVKSTMLLTEGDGSAGTQVYLDTS